MLLVPAAGLWAQDGRIVTPAEVRQATSSPVLWPLRILSAPHRFVSAGLEKGLLAVERRRYRERLQAFTEQLRSHGVEYRFGGSGEGAGLGGGGAYTLRTGPGQELRLLGLATFKRYQEFDLRWTAEMGEAGSLIAESSYQWRPDENFYGLGHGSLKEKHSQFALRQSWTGIRWELRSRHWRGGTLYRLAWLRAQAGGNPAYSPPDVFFTNLPAYDRETRLQSAGAYLDMDVLQGEYQWGGAAHWGASYQHGLGPAHLRYFAYEMRLEGRMPVVARSSALVGEANFELTRTRAGSDPVPFYLLPHVGGSSTLRGFALDRFYGQNLALLSLEYRYRVHPSVQAIPFFDEGQIFDRTGDLSWLNWHRNYGLGFRFRTAAGTFLRVEYGHSSEGFQLHLTFGDRERPPLRAPIRYGVYKR